MIPGHRLLARQDHARLRGVLPNVVGQHLVHAHPAMNDRPLLYGHSRKQAAGHGGMYSQARGRPVEQAVDDVDLRFHRFERFERFAQLHVRPGAFGPPVVRVHAVAHEQDREALRKRGGRGGFAGVRRVHAPPGNRFQPGKGHRDTDAAQECAPRNAATAGARRLLVKVHHFYLSARSSRPRLVRNCRLVTMLSMRPSKR